MKKNYDKIKAQPHFFMFYFFLLIIPDKKCIYCNYINYDNQKRMAVDIPKYVEIKVYGLTYGEFLTIHGLKQRGEACRPI